MNRFFALLALCLLTLSLSAQIRVADASGAIKALGAYEASFVVSSSGGAFEGHYQVDGERFYIFLQGIELYGDGAVRYQIDQEAMSVVIDSLSAQDRALLLDNPATAFDFAEQLFDEIVISQSEEQSSILLKTREGAEQAVDNIILLLDNATSLPLSICYASQGDSVTVDFSSFGSIKGEVHSFSIDNYPDFQIVDFR